MQQRGESSEIYGRVIPGSGDNRPGMAVPAAVRAGKQEIGNPMGCQHRSSGVERTLLKAEEIARLLAIPNPNDPIGLRDRAILELFYATGIRRSEMANLDLGDYEAHGQNLNMYGTNQRPFQPQNRNRNRNRKRKRKKMIL